MLPHVLNCPSAKSFNVAVSTVDDRASARHAETHAEVPEIPSNRDAFTPPSRNAPFANCVPLPLFGMYRHGAGVFPLLSIAHAMSCGGADAQSAFVALNS